MSKFETKTIYTFIPSAAFAAIATPEELALAEVYPVVNSVRINKVYRKKADAARFMKAGFKITFVTKTQFVIDDQSIGSIGESTIGPMIVIDRVEDKYDDSMGAYQVAYGRDAVGNEMSESNMYDPRSVYTVGPVQD
jgi:hypothetical protein